jgi:signal transduction histidine kinase
MHALRAGAPIAFASACVWRREAYGRTMLRDFVAQNREEILARARVRVTARNSPVATALELTAGLPVFLDQLDEALRKATAMEVIDHVELQESAGRHGQALFRQGLTVAQVVHDYGDLCQVITGYAIEQKASVPVEEFQTLNLCLDDAIAGAVTAFSQQRERALTDESTERLGILAHEMRNVLNAAMLSFSSIRTGVVAPGGSTSVIHERSLLRLQALIDRSLADVRLDAGMQNLERVPVWEVMQEVEIAGSIIAQSRGLQLVVATVDRDVIVSADRQILAAAVANLLQNALKFTRGGTKVALSASTTATRVLIEVRDECGGLPEGAPENLLRPFVQGGRDRTGLGLGLAICAKAVKAVGGELRITDIPGHGCVFTIDLPKQPPPPTSIHAHQRKLASGLSEESGGGQTARAI